MKNTFTKVSKVLSFAILIMALLFIGSTAKAQVIINETFDDPFWSAAGGAGPATINYSSSTNSTYTFWTTYGCTTSAGTQTAVNNAPNTGIWFYSSASTCSGSGMKSVHSLQHSMKLNSSKSYIITPLIPSGVASVTFWLTSGNSPSVTVALLTGTNTVNAAPASAAIAAAVAAAGASSQNTWPSSVVTNGTGGTNTYIQQVTYSTSFAGPCQVVLYNSSGNSAYIDDIMITAAALAPTATTGSASSIETSTATLNGSVNANGSSTATSFDYGTSVSYGTNVAGTPTPVTGNSGTAVSAAISSLTGNTVYHFRVNGVSVGGTTNGSDANFTTLPAAPTISGGNNTSAQSSATSAGFTAFWTATAQGSALAITYTLDYSTDNTFTSGVTTVTGISGTSDAIAGLSPSTPYYYRVTAVTSAGSNDIGSSPISSSVTTSAPAPTLSPSGSLSDFGNITINQISAEQHYQLSGVFLDGSDITVTAPSGFLVSLTSGSGYASTATITTANANYTSGTTLNATNIYVVFAPTSVGATGTLNIQNSGGGASSVNVPASGTGVAVTSPTSFTVADKSDNIIHLTWTAPSGSYDKVIIFARAASDVNYTPSGAGSAYNNANANIGSAGVYNTDNFLVYSGTGNSLEVTGLSNTTTYYFQAFAYSGNAYSSAASANALTAVQPVTSFSASIANTQSVLAWTNPTFNVTQSNYWDDVVILAKGGGTVTDVPTGSGGYNAGGNVYGSGDLVGSSYVVYEGTSTGVTVTGLTNGTAYDYKAYVRHGSTWSVATDATATPVAYAVNDYGSIATGTWAGTTTWGKWNGTTFVATATPPGVGDNVNIVGGFTVTAAAAGSCKDLHVTNGTLKSGTVCHSVEAIAVNGTTIEVTSGGTIGNGLSDDAADGISIQIKNAGTTTVTGSGGTIDVSKFTIETANAAVIIDHDMTVHYHGSSDGGNAYGLYTNNITPASLTINAGKTITMAKWSSFSASSSSGTSGQAAVNFTVNVNGTLAFTRGVPSGHTGPPSGFPNSNNAYLSLSADATHTFTFNVGSTGTVNVVEFYPNGESNGSGAGGGSLSTITVASGGSINVDSLADFRNANQTVTGSGTFRLNTTPGVRIRIGSASGITASSANGPIQTSTRIFNSQNDYQYDGTTAQVTGDGLPSTVNNLTINNSTGVSLSQGTTVNGILSSTSGKLSIGANTLSLAGTVTGMSATNSLTGGASSVLSITGTGALGSLFFDQTTPGATNQLSSFTINRTSSGTLTLANAVAITNALTITNGVVTLSNTGNTAGSLTLGSAGTDNGTWGSTSSTATFNNNTYFASTGIVTVSNNTALTPTVTPTVGTYNYNGSPQGPNAATNTGTGTNYSFSYVGVGATTYGPSATQPTNVGSYTVTATVAASVDGFYQQASSSPTAFSIVGAGQSTADFRSSGSGNFSDASNWQYDAGGGNWVTATQAPTSTNNVTVQNGNDLVLDIDYTVGSGKTFTLNSTSSLTISPTVTLTIAGTTDFNSQHVIVGSDATGTASIGQITGTLSNATNVTVERYIPANPERAWRLLAVPTSGTQTINAAWQEGQINQTNTTPGYGTIITAKAPDANYVAEGFDTIQVASSILTYNAGGNSWAQPSSTYNTLATTSGYFLYIRGNRLEKPAGTAGPTNPTTLRTTGGLYQGTQTAISVPGGGFGLIGNVYASAIDFTALTRDAGVDDLFYVWDPKLLDAPPSLGAYVTFSQVNGWIPVPGALGVGSYGNTANTLIQSGQAFFVSATSTGNIQLTESSKVTGSVNVYRPASPESTSGRLTTNLYSVSGTSSSLADGNVAVFNSAYADAVDGNDALKLSNTEENFGILRSGKILVIEARQPVASTDTIFFDMWNMKQQQYKLEFTPSSLNTGSLSAYLEDSYLGSRTAIDVNNVSDIAFTVDGTAASSASNRFRVVFNSSSPVPVRFTNISAQATSAHAVSVSWQVGVESGISYYQVERSTDGKTFTSIGQVTAKGSSTYSLVDAGTLSGAYYYRVKGIGTSGEVEYSAIVKVTIGSTAAGIAIYPNPVKGGHISLELDNQPAGTYTVRLLGINGQEISRSIVSHGGGSSVQGVEVPTKLAAGVYKLEVSSPAKVKYTANVVIE